LCPSPTGRPSVRRAAGRGSPAAPPRRQAFRRDRDRREEQPTGRPSCTRGPARLARRTSGWPRRGQPVRVRRVRPWAAAQPGRRLRGGVGVVAAAHAGPPSRAATTPRPSSPPRSPRAGFGCRPAGSRWCAGRCPCLDRRIDGGRRLGEVPDPVDLGVQELACRRGGGAPVRCLCHARAQGRRIAGGSRSARGLLVDRVGLAGPGPVGSRTGGRGRRRGRFGRARSPGPGSRWIRGRSCRGCLWWLASEYSPCWVRQRLRP
jgi:hypothetical protein